MIEVSFDGDGDDHARAVPAIRIEFAEASLS